MLKFDDRPWIRKELTKAFKAVEHNPYDERLLKRSQQFQTTYSMLLLSEDECMEQFDATVMRMCEL